MKVLRICRTYPRTALPGAGLPAYYLAKYIDEPHLFLTKRFPGEPLPPPRHVRLVEFNYPEVTFPERLVGLKRWVLMTGKALGYCSFLLQSLPAVMKFRPDIVHLHTVLPFLHGMTVNLVCGAKILLTFHGTDLLRVQQNRWLVGLINRWVHTVCFVSSSMLPQLQLLFPRRRLLYTPSGVDLDQFKPSTQQRQQQIVAIGNLRWQKGYPDLLRAAARVNQRHGDWRFVIVGDGPQRSELERMTDDLGLCGTVEFVGMQSREAIARHLQRSSILVLSSVTEGFPKVLLEAMATETPVVATDVGCCEEVLGGAGLVVQKKDPAKLAAGLLQLIENPALRLQLAESGPAVAARYRWEDTAKIVHEEYRCLLETSRAG